VTFVGTQRTFKRWRGVYNVDATVTQPGDFKMSVDEALESLIGAATGMSSLFILRHCCYTVFRSLSK